MQIEKNAVAGTLESSYRPKQRPPFRRALPRNLKKRIVSPIRLNEYALLSRLLLGHEDRADQQHDADDDQHEGDRVQRRVEHR